MIYIQEGYADVTAGAYFKGLVFLAFMIFYFRRRLINTNITACFLPQCQEFLLGASKMPPAMAISRHATQKYPHRRHSSVSLPLLQAQSSRLQYRTARLYHPHLRRDTEKPIIYYRNSFVESTR